MENQILKQELGKRNIPELLQFIDGTKVIDSSSWMKRREEIKHLLCEEFFGFPPTFKIKVHGNVVKEDKNSYGGKAITKTIDLQIESPYSYVSFLFQLCIPKEVKNPPVFLNLSFTPVIADGLGEEIIDNGYAIANVYYQDITADKNDNFTSGVGRFCTINQFDSWGKLSMWAWGASRIMDYLMEQDDIDRTRIAIVGHSRLGKTALVCGAMDERFSFVISNNSGGGGAALFRGKVGEGIKNLEGSGSRCWFCGNFFRYSDSTNDLPFDQHFLLAMMAPRKLYVASASLDEWADPKSEFLACVATSPVYELLGDKGFIHSDKFPEDNELFHEGSIGYHLRKGTHHMGRFDWHQIMAYRSVHEV